MIEISISPEKYHLGDILKLADGKIARVVFIDVDKSMIQVEPFYDIKEGKETHKYKPNKFVKDIIDWHFW